MVLGVINYILGFLFLFFLTGFFLTCRRNKEKDKGKDKYDLIEKVGVAILVSICINILIGLVLGFFGIFNVYCLWIAIIFVSAVCFLIFLDNLRAGGGRGGRNIFGIFGNIRWKEFFILLLVLAIVFLLIFKIHFSYTGPYGDFTGEGLKQAKGLDYDFPYHFDEWTHLAQSVYIIDQEKLPFKNPYIQEDKIRNLEVGFHVFVAEYFLLTGSDPVLGYQFLPAIFAVLSSIFIYVILRKLINVGCYCKDADDNSRDYGIVEGVNRGSARKITNKDKVYLDNRFITGIFAGILGIIFFVFIKSNVNVLGNWFFTPSSMAVLFMLGIFYFVLQRSILLLGLTSVVGFFVYPPIAIFGFVCATYQLLKKKTFFILVGSALLLLGIIFLFRITPLYRLTLKLISQAVFAEGWAIAFTFQSPGFNILLMTFGFYGFFNIVFNKELRKKWGSIWSFAFLNILTILLYILFSSTFIMPVVRAAYYIQIVMCLFAGFGVMKFFEILGVKEKVFGVGVDRSYKKLFVIIFVSVIFLILIFQFFMYYKNIDEEFAVSHAIDNNDYEALKFIGGVSGDFLVLADPVKSIAVYPVAKKQVVSFLSSNIGGGYRFLQYRFFVRKTCEERFELLDSLSKGLDKDVYVFVEEQIECDFLKQVYARDGRFVYKFEK